VERDSARLRPSACTVQRTAAPRVSGVRDERCDDGEREQDLVRGPDEDEHGDPEADGDEAPDAPLDDGPGT